MLSPVVIFPGFGNSGPRHWQSLWEQANADFARIDPVDWDHPRRSEWVSALEGTVRRLGPSAVVAAHSMGCLAVAHWAAGRHAPIKGALLVAVPDPGNSHFPSEATGFGPVPARRFSFPSIVVASTDDAYGSLAFSERCAAAWGSRLVNIGAAGHINADSGLGAWDEGLALLQGLRG